MCILYWILDYTGFSFSTDLRLFILVLLELKNLIKIICEHTYYQNILNI